MFRYELVTVQYCGRSICAAVIYDKNYKYHKAACHFLLEVAKKSRTKMNTVRARASDLKRFLSSISEKKSPSPLFCQNFRYINDNQMSAYLLKLHHDGLSAKSLARHISTLDEFYKFIYKFGYIDCPKYFSFSTAEKVETMQLVEKATSRILSQYIRIEDFNTILSHVVANDCHKRARDELALKLGYYAGIRTHELVAFDNFSIANLRKQFSNEISNFFAYEFISIIGKGYKRRSIPLTMELKKSLHRFLYGDYAGIVKKHLFERSNGFAIKDLSYGTNTFRKAVRKFLATTIVSKELRETYSNWSYHSLRHTCATNFVTFCDYNGNHKYDPILYLPQWLGHCSIETSKLYICSEALLHRNLEVFLKLDELSCFNDGD